MDDYKTNYILNNYKKMAISHIAKELDITIPQVSRVLRSHAKLREINYVELDYILENKDKKSLVDIEKELGLTNTQFSQICGRYNLGNKNKNINLYTVDEIIKKFKNLIEEKLREKVDDILASKITSEKIISAGGYYLIKYAEIHKKNDSIYKYFSAIAYLFNLAYPNKFKPYQFAHSKDTKKYFNSSVYIGELITLLQDKIGINLNNINILVKSNSFLSREQLQFYGLGPNIYIPIFGSKKEMERKLLFHLNKGNIVSYEKTNKLKAKLEENNIKCNVCYYSGCNNKIIEIHHIYHKKYSSIVNFNIDEQFNLIPLCKEHHSMAQKMDIGLLNLHSKNEWRNDVIKYLKSLEECESNIEINS